jgi:hypothetical protein
MMGKSERKANDGEEQETNMRMMGKSERHANDGEEREKGNQVIENIEQETE